MKRILYILLKEMYEQEIWDRIEEFWPASNVALKVGILGMPGMARSFEN